MNIQTFLYILLATVLISSRAAAQQDRLPDGTPFPSWERPLQFSKTYSVDGRSPNADDGGPGTRERPFRTINRAAQVLQPGERVLIAEGVYRESVHPARGGTGPDKMISYEAAEGARVVLKGSVVVKGSWKPSTGWRVRGIVTTQPRIWELRLDGAWFGGYNPFGMANVLHDRYWIDYRTADMAPYWRRRGMVFVDGKPLEQVEMYSELAGVMDRPLSRTSDRTLSLELFAEFSGGAGKFWTEHNGLTLHVRLAGDDSPENHTVEITTKEQVFAPQERFLGYIRVKGLHIEHAGNGFPVPQGGLVSTNRGHHWIIEDNTIQWANAVALDIGKQDWNATNPPIKGHHIIRGNTIRYAGICGIAGPETENTLVERNLVEWAGWQDAQRMWESAGIKLHNAVNLLLRDNVVRHMRHASGIWLDVGNKNCRLTRNIFADATTINAVIHVEGTHDQNQIDNNIIWGARRPPGDQRGGSGLFIQGTDKLIVAHNLIGACDASGVYAATEHLRILMGRGGTARGNRVLNNIFVDCRQSAIEFANPYNESDGNAYSKMPGGFLRIMNPAPGEFLDLDAAREFHGWEKNGQMTEVDVSFDPKSLRLSLAVKGEMPKLPLFKGITTDFFGIDSRDRRIPGPFADTSGITNRIADPRNRK